MGIVLNEIYKRVLSSQFSIIEELLDEMEEAISQKKENIFSKVLCDIGEKEKGEILEKINTMKNYLILVKNKLGLQKEIYNCSTIISSRSGKLWEILCDMKTEKLKRYGKAPHKLKVFLDPIVEKMININEEIVKSLHKKKY